MNADFTNFLDRAKPLGVLYVDVYPYAYTESGELEFLLFRRLPSVVMPGQWQPICGKINKEERISEAFHRQVTKKTGFPPIELFKIDYVNIFYDDYYDTVMFVPSAACEVGREVTLDASLHDDAKFVKPSQLTEYGLFDAQLRAYDILQATLARRKQHSHKA
jgi:hypothetical protein